MNSDAITFTTDEFRDLIEIAEKLLTRMTESMRAQAENHTRQDLQEEEEDDFPFFDLDDLLAPTAGCIGWQQEIHGPGARKVPEFVPTQHEVLIIAKHWLRECLAVSFDWFYHQQSGSREIRIRLFAAVRLGLIGRILGADAF